MRTNQILIFLLLIIAACNDKENGVNDIDENGNYIVDTNNNDTLPIDSNIIDTVSYYDTICQKALCINNMFELQYGQRTTLVDTIFQKTYKVCFNGKIMDGRCPYHNCFLCDPGWAELEIQWITEENDTTIIPLWIQGCIAVKICNEDTDLDTLGYKFCFISLKPYENAENQLLQDDDYSVILNIY
jgi:hypothetical protein